MHLTLPAPRPPLVGWQVCVVVVVDVSVLPLLLTHLFGHLLCVQVTAYIHAEVPAKPTQRTDKRVLWLWLARKVSQLPSSRSFPSLPQAALRCFLARVLIDPLDFSEYVHDCSDKTL